MNFNLFSPIHSFTNWFIFTVLNLSAETAMTKSLEFFLYDSLKILVLMIMITHFMSMLRYYLPIEKIRIFLIQNKLYGLDYFLATVFGAITPFCTCSSIPLFMGFLEARIPLGVTFAFMITSPLVNEVAIALFIGIFGLKITIIYVLAGIIMGMIGGYILGKLKMEKYVEDFIWNLQAKKTETSKKTKASLKKNFPKISKEAFGITKKMVPYLVIGIAVGSLIHGYVPAGFFEKYLESAGFWGVPLATILAVPMYANASGVIPIIQSLVEKGVPLGTALTFMMAVVGLSLPEALILKKVLKLPLLLTFFGVVTIGIMIMGFIFNILFV